MNKIYLPISKGKIKTSARGFWIAHGLVCSKVYYDYIVLLPKDKINLKEIDRLKRQSRQICLFYEYENKGYIYYNKRHIKVLQDKKLITIKKDFRGLKDRLKTLLNKYGGLTIYIGKSSYLIEIFY